jgi:O-antigen ligase
MIATSRWDLRRGILSALLLTHVWRLQDLIPALTLFKPLLLSTALAIGYEVLAPGTLERFGRRGRHATIAWALVLLALGALSVPGSLYPGLSFDFLLKNQLDAVLVLLLLVGGTRDIGDVVRFASVQVAGAAFYTGVVLQRYDVGPSGRLGSLVYYDANDLGMLLACTLPLALYFMGRGHRLLTRAAAAGAVGLFLVGIVRTGSRGAFLGLIAVSLYTLFRAGHIALRWRVGATALAAVLLIVVSSDRYWTTMRSLLQPRQDYNWVGREPGGRMEVWRRGVGYMIANPFLGVGVGAFPVAEGTISPLASRQSYGGGAKWSAAHNSFVQIGAELGICGLVGFLAMLWSAYRGVTVRGGPYSGAAHALAAALLGFAVTGAFLSQAYSTFLYSLLALAVGATQRTVIRRHRPPPRVEGHETPVLVGGAA